MTHYWFCGVCESTVVDRSGDTCVRCRATIDALTDPITRPPLTMRAPLGVRILRWLNGWTVA